jgi:hypothetical protein
MTGEAPILPNPCLTQWGWRLSCFFLVPPHGGLETTTSEG